MGSGPRVDGRARSNRAWCEALAGAGAGSAEAVGELQAYLGRVLGKLVGRSLPADDVAELVQESLARIVKGLHTFRGDSAFTTWAAGVATRVAYTELRRRRVREGAFTRIEDEARQLPCARTPSPEHAAARADVLRALRTAIAERLTERQRTAVLAELRGLPTVEIAERLQTNTNALYKLTHDARKKLRAALLDAGFDAHAIHSAVTGGAP